MVKEKPFNMILEPSSKYFYLSLAYNTTSGNIKLPRMRWRYLYGKNPLPESIINLPMLVRCFTHEILHKWVHENEGIKACDMLDAIDIKVDERGRRVFTGAVN